VAGGSTKRAGCLAALAVLALAAPGLARAGTGSPAARHVGARGIATQGRGTDALGGSSKSALIAGRLVNHGGPVMATNVVHAMYWFPPGYTLSSSWRDTVDGYLGAVAGDSGKTSNVFSVTPQYGVSYSAQFLGSAVDTTPFPTSGCDAGVGGKPCLSEEQIFDELDAFAQRQGWAADPNDGSSPSSHPTHFFAVYLPQGVADCYDEAGGACSANSTKSYYCAYHTAWYDDTQTFIWANLPWSWNAAGCQGGSYPNDRAADTAIDVTSHEYIESLTDPFLNAWYDAGGYEIADKCQTTYGSVLNSALPNYNQLIGAGHYWTQLEYSNALGNCYQLGAPAISSLSPTAAAAGQTVQISGENFYGPVVVRFNGIVAGVLSVSPSAISVRVPVGQVFGPVTVQAIGGRATSATDFGFPLPAVSGLSAVDGKVGNTVTITGSGFASATKVMFGNVADTTFHVDDDSTITAHVPDRFSSGKVKVTNPSGSGSSAEPFAVTKVSRFAPATAKAGTTVTISGQGLGSATSVDFPNHAAVAVASAAPGYVKVVVPADATYGPLDVHTPNIDPAGIATTRFKATPTIASSTPDGKVGSAVTITGANLSDATAVKFGSIGVTFSADPAGTSISTTVPAGVVSSARITVVTPHGSVVAPTAFQVTKVTGVSPASAAAGATVTITGQGLKSTGTVDFPGAAGVAVLSTAPSYVKVRVPAGATLGSLTIHTPNIDGAGLSTAKPFKPLPRIASFDAASYQAGAVVTAQGSNLVETGAYTAKIGSVAVDDLQIVDAQTLTFEVPAAAVSGKLTFANASGATASAGSVLVRPTVDSFAPGDTTTGQKVTLTGATFKGTTAVTFGGVRASFSVARDGASLVATVPNAAVDGAVAVTNAGGTTSAVDTFHVDPTVRGFSPASGPVGAVVTVTGTGLKSVASVDFGGVAATPTATAATWLKVAVPPGATSGPIGVHGFAAGATGRPFQVTFSITGFSQPYGAPGATVSLNGVGLTGVTSVTFGPLAASISAQTGTSLSVVVPAIAGDTTVTVTKGRSTIQAPAQFGLFAVASVSPHALAPGGTLRLTGSHLGGASATFAGASSPVAVANDGSATVPAGFIGGTVTIADPYGDSVDETIPLFAVASYSPADAGPGDAVTIDLAAGGEYSSADVQVKFDGVAVAATGGDGAVTVHVPAGATSGALQVEADESGWATGPAFTVDRAGVELQSVEPGHVTLKATSAGGIGDTMVTWRQDGSTHTIDLAPRDVAAGDTIDVDAGFTLGELTIEVGTPLAVEDGIALNDGGTPSDGFVSDVAALQADGVWGSSDSFDWSALADGQSVSRVAESTPDDVPDWGIS